MFRQVRKVVFVCLELAIRSVFFNFICVIVLSHCLGAIFFFRILRIIIIVFKLLSGCVLIGFDAKSGFVHVLLRFVSRMSMIVVLYKPSISPGGVHLYDCIFLLKIKK